MSNESKTKETSSNKRVVKNYIYNVLYEIIVVLAPFITTPYVSRVLGVTGIGVYNYARSIATYFVLIGAVGTTLYGQREIAYVQDDEEKRSKAFWEITIFRFIAVIACTLIYYFTFGQFTEYSTVYRVLAIEVAATAFDISWFFMGMENFKLTVIRNTIIKIAGIVLVFVLVRSEKDVVLYTVCLTLPIFVGNISLWISLPKYIKRVKISFRDIFKRTKPILILFLPQIATEVYTVLDKTMLGALSSNIDEVGFYTQSEKIVKIVKMIITSLGTVMLPAMSFAFAKGEMDKIKKNIKSSFGFVFMAGFALMFGLCGIAKNFVPIFFGKGYDKCAPLIIVISPILILIGCSNVIGKQYLLPTKQQKLFTISVITGAVTNLICNIFFIKLLDSIGASIATVIAEFAVLAVQSFAVRKQLPLKEIYLSCIKYLVVGLIMGVLVYFTGELMGKGIIVLIVQAAVGCIFYLGIMLLTKDELVMNGINAVLSKIKKGGNKK